MGVGVVMEAEQEICNPCDEDDIIHHYERWLWIYSKLLHPHHYLLIDVKQKLGSLYGNFSPYLLLDLSRPLLDRKMQVCQDVLDVVSKVDPGYTKLRGKMMGEV